MFCPKKFATFVAKSFNLKKSENMKKISRLFAVAVLILSSATLNANELTATRFDNDSTGAISTESNATGQVLGGGAYANIPSNTSVTGGTGNVTAVTATIFGYANNVTLGDNSYAGICYSSTNVNPTTADATLTSVSLDQNNRYSVTASDLEPGTTYYYRAYVYRGGLTQYAARVYSFTTQHIVTTGNADAVTASNATLTGNFHMPSSAYTSISCGICYSSVKTIPTTSDFKATAAVAGDAFSVRLTNLENNTRYYYRAYTIIDGRTIYGEPRSFMTTHLNIRKDIAVTGTIAQAENTLEHIVTNIANIGGINFSSITLGVCWSSTNNDPTIKDFTASTQQMDAESKYKVAMTGLETITSCYYRAYVKTDEDVYYGEVKSFVVGQKSYVNLGLPSGTLWATCNLGAATPEEYGDYFAWGETVPKAKYSWSTYKYSKGSYSSLTKYCNDIYYGYKKHYDAINILDKSDDAAYKSWGGNWRMPTSEELRELMDPNNCQWIWYESGNNEFNGVAGYRVQSKMTGYTENYIFLPAAGMVTNSKVENEGETCRYWSDSIYDDYPAGAWSFVLDSNDYNIRGESRFIGQSVRPVCN